MIHDSSILWGYTFDKVIPKFEQLNAILLSGSFGRLAEWEPLEITTKEYSEIVEQLLNISMIQPYKKT